MKLSSMKKAVAFGAAAAFVFTAGVAKAGVNIGEETKCRAAVAKKLSSLNKAAHKAQVSCVKNVLNAKQILADGQKCHQISTADTGGKVASAAAAFQGAVGPVGESCDNAADNISLAGYQPNCQVGVGGVGQAIADFDDVSDCLVSAGQGAAALVFGEVLNPDYDAILADAAAGDLEKCANAIAKNTTKAVSTILKERTKAQNGVEKDSVATSAAYGQFSLSNSKINDAITKMRDAVNGACAAPDVPSNTIQLLGSCSSTLAGLTTAGTGCLEGAVRDTGEGLASMAYQNKNEYPSRADVFINAGTTVTGTGSAIDGTTGSRRNRTQLDAGFTGLGHRVDVIDGFEGAVELNCGGDGVCDVDPSCVKNNCRCSNSVTTLCDEPFVVDVDDCGAGTCQVFFGPPLDLSAAGTPTCVVNRIDALTGSVDLADGNSTTTVSNTSLVHLDEDGQNQPCPKCVGGSEAFGTAGFNNDVRTGTCDGGVGYPSQGNACDANGFSSTFGLTSYDCPPNPGKNVSGAGLDITLVISDEPADLGTGTTSCGGALPGEDCHCRVCTLNTAVPCANNTDCTGVGTCTGTTGASPQVLPNGCSSDSFTCDPDGLCNIDATLFCDGFLRADGRGLYPCLNDASCVTIAGECPGGDCGLCTLSEPVPCLPDIINARNLTNSGSEHAVLGTNFCIPPTSNPGVNAAAGTPGPGRVMIDFNFDILCDNGITEAVYGGFNCP